MISGDDNRRAAEGRRMAIHVLQLLSLGASSDDKRGLTADGEHIVPALVNVATGVLVHGVPYSFARLALVLVVIERCLRIGHKIAFAGRQSANWTALVNGSERGATVDGEGAWKALKDCPNARRRLLDRVQSVPARDGRPAIRGRPSRACACSIGSAAAAAAATRRQRRDTDATPRATLRRRKQSIRRPNARADFEVVNHVV